MAPRKSTKTLPAPADTLIFAALREEEELDSTTNCNSDSDDDDEIANTADVEQP
ncbi:hypothetical protein K443DRAFT_6002 [Laccaria amethystina LaAM-08-1]|uniref:Uncharacterized protein n=1 Tax=Laccaria amethystina LaAM-08-1 TaxID=1095629 RepID=A0A0C9Y3B6_9AGAR|nr:hypothetical protein K443DRAFT_6002 [Laccaria amethystina LaAM-08-1]